MLKNEIIFLLAFVVFGIVFSCSQKQEKMGRKEGIQNNEVTRTLDFPYGKKIFVRAKFWGISGNHEEIVFSESPITIPSKENDYIFYTDEVFYKINNNVLTIYAPESGKNIPRISFKNIEIIFKGLKTYDEIRDYNTNYQKYDLERISVYK